MEFSQSDLVLLRGEYSREVKSGHFVRVKQGAAIRCDPELEALPEWEKRAFVARARIAAMSATMRRSLVFTRESAAILHGIELWGTNPDVSFAVRGRCRSLRLPEVRLGDTRIAPVRTRPMAPDAEHSAVVIARGLRATSLEATAVDCALDLLPLPAFVIVSGILRAMAQFDRFTLVESRDRERRAKAALLARLKTTGADSPRARHARTLIEMADGACESVGERVVHFVLITLFPKIVTTQLEVRTKGRTYFLDFGILGLKIAIEFDGIIKMGEDPASFRKAQAELLARQRDLEDAGWTVIRVGWDELLDLTALRDKLYRRIIAVAARPMLPDGRTQDLWTREIASRGFVRAARRRKDEAEHPDAR